MLKVGDIIVYKGHNKDWTASKYKFMIKSIREEYCSVECLQTTSNPTVLIGYVYDFVPKSDLITWTKLIKKSHLPGWF